MAYFKPATLSFTAPRDFFDNVGRNAPVTRFNIELPKELVDYSKTEGSAPYTLEPVDQQLLTEIQSAILRQYGGVARQFLGAFRQGVDLADLGVTNRMAALDNGVGMNYAAQFGREMISINVSADVVRKLVGKAEDLFMLVLYGNNKIATVKVSATGSFSLVSKRTLAKSSWGSPHWNGWYTKNTPQFFLKTAQLKISKNLHAMTCPIKIVGGVISIPDNMEQRPFYNVADSLHKFAECSMIISNQAGYSGYSFGPPNDPIINGTGDYIYNEYLDKFQSTATGIVRAAVGATELDPVYYDYIWANPSAIDVNGDRWGQVFVYRYTQNINNHQKWNGAASRPYTLAQSLATDPWYFGSLGATLSSCRFGPGPTDFTGDYNTAYVDMGVVSISTTTKMMVYGKSSGNDAISIIPISVTATANLTATSLTLTSDYNGITANSNNSFPDHGADTFSFPYPITQTSEGMYYRIVNIEDSNGFSYTYHTPYETWNTGYLLNPEYYSTQYDPYYSGWLQVSNGVHMIQGYIKSGSKRIFMDGVEAGSSLAATIGCSVDDIVTLFLDVKKTDIDKLK